MKKILLALALFAVIAPVGASTALAYGCTYTNYGYTCGNHISANKITVNYGGCGRYCYGNTYSNDYNPCRYNCYGRNNRNSDCYYCGRSYRSRNVDVDFGVNYQYDSWY